MSVYGAVVNLAPAKHRELADFATTPHVFEGEPRAIVCSESGNLNIKLEGDEDYAVSWFPAGWNPVEVRAISNTSSDPITVEGWW